jgi:hypothetical protein
MSDEGGANKPGLFANLSAEDKAKIREVGMRGGKSALDRYCEEAGLDPLMSIEDLIQAIPTTLGLWILIFHLNPRIRIFELFEIKE